MMSSSIFPSRLTRIDSTTLPDHFYLEESDKCFFFGGYRSGAGVGYSTMNQHILNFKKDVGRRGKPEWVHKERAIQDAAAAFSKLLRGSNSRDCTFVPIPPSKAKNDPLYDDRMVKMLKAISPGDPLDVKELIVQSATSAATHASSNRPNPREIAARYSIDRSLINGCPDTICICDDVLVSGTHFKAAQLILNETFPGVKTIGLFIARRVPQ